MSCSGSLGYGWHRAKVIVQGDTKFLTVAHKAFMQQTQQTLSKSWIQKRLDFIAHCCLLKL